MAEQSEHLANLKAARGKEVAQRREVAQALAGEHRRGDIEGMRELFINLQRSIEAIDRAIADESVPAKGPLKISDEALAQSKRRSTPTV
jgi:hypothetical protein